MKVALSNFSRPLPLGMDFSSYWAEHVMAHGEKQLSLFDYVGWGFHIYAIGVYLLESGLADEVEFWDFRQRRSVSYHPLGVRRIHFFNESDVMAYLDRYGYPDLYINYGRYGLSMLDHLKRLSFRVHIPCLKPAQARQDDLSAECYLVDSEQYLDSRSMLYVPVVNTKRIFPISCEKKRDFIYLASYRPSKRHDILLGAVRGTGLTGRLHPVASALFDLTDTNITTTNWDEADVVDLLRTSRIAVYPADRDSNPAAMWECVAAGLPIVVNENIEGGKHLVVPGVTGEFASEDNFHDVMAHVLAHLDSYTPREYFMQEWDTVPTLERYLTFFRTNGWRG